MNNNIWKYIVVIESLVIVHLVRKIRRPSKNNLEELKQYKGKDVDVGNVIDSIHGAKSLFKQLSKKYHPDKYTNTDKHAIALDIYQRMTNNRRNFKVLKELEKEAISNL